MTRTWNDAHQLIDLRRRWEISGQLHGNTSAEIITAKAALEAAYAIPYQDLILYLDDGSTIHDSLLNRGSSTGVKIIAGPDYPVDRGAEGGTFLTYAIVAEAAYEFNQPQAGGGSDPDRLESWTETIAVSGGGPRYAMVEVVDGPPVRQLIVGQTKTRIMQSGQAVGRRRHPSPPTPALPDWENPAERQITQVSPGQEGQQATGYTTTWSYVFEGPGLGAPEPNPWPL